jgi:hypothetical protein
MKPTEKQIERAALAILNRRIQPDYNRVDENNVFLIDNDRELAVAALTAALEGCAIVPIEPTEEMLDELGDDGYNSAKLKRRYAAMLGVVP